MNSFKKVMIYSTITAAFIFLNRLECTGQNQNLSSGVVFDGEPYLAVNPYHPQHMVVAWMGYTFMQKITIKTRVSFDGGVSWSTLHSIPHQNNIYTSADPSIDFDHLGRVYLSYIDYDPAFSSGYVFLRRSEDGGISWSSPVTAIAWDSDPGRYPIDRPWLSIDRNAGNQQGNIYITTMNAKAAGAPPYHPYFVKSVDMGESFEPYRYLDTAGWLSGPFIPKPMPAPAIGANGDFYAVYPSYVFSQNFQPQYILASSSDAGNNFEYQTLFASASSVAVSDTSAKKGYLLRADPSDPSHLVFFHLSNENGDADIYFRESFDYGQNWSEGRRINDDPPGNGRMQDLVWADFDSDGDLAVAWRDRRNAADTGYAASYEIFAAVRLKNTSDFLPNFRLTNSIVAFDDVLFQNGNDFMCLNLSNDTISAVWGDTRDGRLNIWFQRASLSGTLLSRKNLDGSALPAIEITFPSASLMQVNSESFNEFKLLDTRGKECIKKTGLNGRNSLTINTSALKTGVYIVQIMVAYGKVSSKVFIR